MMQYSYMRRLHRKTPPRLSELDNPVPGETKSRNGLGMTVRHVFDLEEDDRHPLLSDIAGILHHFASVINVAKARICLLPLP